MFKYNFVGEKKLNPQFNYGNPKLQLQKQNCNKQKTTAFQRKYTKKVQGNFLNILVTQKTLFLEVFYLY